VLCFYKALNVTVSAQFAKLLRKLNLNFVLFLCLIDTTALIEGARPSTKLESGAPMVCRARPGKQRPP
jgi:hypothetical protein